MVKGRILAMGLFIALGIAGCASGATEATPAQTSSPVSFLDQPPTTEPTVVPPSTAATRTTVTTAPSSTAAQTSAAEQFEFAVVDVGTVTIANTMPDWWTASREGFTTVLVRLQRKNVGDEILRDGLMLRVLAEAGEPEGLVWEYELQDPTGLVHDHQAFYAPDLLDPNTEFAFQPPGMRVSLHLQFEVPSANLQGSNELGTLTVRRIENTESGSDVVEASFSLPSDVMNPLQRELPAEAYRIGDEIPLGPPDDLAQGAQPDMVLVVESAAYNPEEFTVSVNWVVHNRGNVELPCPTSSEDVAVVAETASGHPLRSGEFAPSDLRCSGSVAPGESRSGQWVFGTVSLHPSLPEVMSDEVILGETVIYLRIEELCSGPVACLQASPLRSNPQGASLWVPLVLDVG